MDQRFHACVIGHITKDTVRIGHTERVMPGGTAYYTSMALRGLGLNVAIITKLGRKDRDYLLRDLNESGVAVLCHEGEETTSFENIYGDKNTDLRIQRVRSVAPPFSLEDLKDIEAVSADVFHVGPLTNKDISDEFLRGVSLRGGLISLDVQGVLRQVSDLKVMERDWEGKEGGLAHVDILKADEKEAKILSGEYDLKKASFRLSGFGPKEIIITRAGKGSLVFSKGRFYGIPAFSPKGIIDPTGCGDTYMAGYLHERLKSHDLDRAGRFGAALATWKLENFGPFRGNERDVRIRMGDTSS